MIASTILTVHWRCDDFTRLLIKTAKGHKLIVVNNDNDAKSFRGAETYSHHDNRHGQGLNFGLTKVTSEYVLILDSDCHLLCEDWEDKFLSAIKDVDVVTVPGSESKPIRVACVFMRTENAREFDWNSTPGYRGNRSTPKGRDVGIDCYYKMVSRGVRFRFMEIKKPDRYGTFNGEEYCLDGKPLVHHIWHGSVLRNEDYPGVDLIADRKKFFDHFKTKTFL